MIIGIPQEIKTDERRVALTPNGAEILIRDGHRVIVEKGAGEKSGFSDECYQAAGADISDKEGVFNSSDLIVKVKEPLPEEYPLLAPEQIIFTYLHLAASENLTRALVERKVVALAYETVQLEDGFLPLLQPMSEVAGSMVGHISAFYLSAAHGGKGILMGGVPGIEPARVVVIGGGTVGATAARMCAGLGAEVVLFELDPQRMRKLNNQFPQHIKVLHSNPKTVENYVENCDVAVGAVLIPGGRPPHVISRELVSRMEMNSVIIDVAVDQGGCTETTRPTTHRKPTYRVDGVIHYAVSNMPAAFPRSSTLALTNATLPYIRELASKGLDKALVENPPLQRGLNIFCGRITNWEVAHTFGIDHIPVSKLDLE